MTEIECPGCGRELSDLLTRCPFCRRPMVRRRRVMRWLAGAIILIALAKLLAALLGESIRRR
jgi:hypothetical protein